MVRKPARILTQGELRIMEVIWKLQKASVKDVTGVLRQKETIAYNTVQTMMGILEQKGFLTHTKSGRSYIYEPLVNRNKARKAALKQLLCNFFDDSPQSLLVNLIEDENLDEADIKELRKLIQSSSQKK